MYIFKIDNKKISLFLILLSVQNFTNLNTANATLPTPSPVPSPTSSVTESETEESCNAKCDAHPTGQAAAYCASMKLYQTAGITYPIIIGLAIPVIALCGTVCVGGNFNPAITLACTTSDAVMAAGTIANVITLSALGEKWTDGLSAASLGVGSAGVVTAGYEATHLPHQIHDAKGFVKGKINDAHQAKMRAKYQIPDKVNADNMAELNQAKKDADGLVMETSDEKPAGKSTKEELSDRAGPCLSFALATVELGIASEKVRITPQKIKKVCDTLKALESKTPAVAPESSPTVSPEPGGVTLDSKSNSDLKTRKHQMTRSYLISLNQLLLQTATASEKTPVSKLSPAETALSYLNNERSIDPSLGPLGQLLLQMPHSSKIPGLMAAQGPSLEEIDHAIDMRMGAAEIVSKFAPKVPPSILEQIAAMEEDIQKNIDQIPDPTGGPLTTTAGTAASVLAARNLPSDMISRSPSSSDQEIWHPNSSETIFEIVSARITTSFNRK